jgi:uncharacterized protein (DUF305 family)
MKNQVVAKLTMISTIVLMAAGVFAMEHGNDNKHEGHDGSHKCGCMKEHEDYDGMNQFPMMLKKKLGLTGKQESDISDIMKAERKDANPLFVATRKERNALMDIAKTGDQAAVRKQAGKLADAETALAMHQAACHKKIAAVMTKEQAEKFEKLSAEFMEHKGSKGMECDKGHKKGHEKGHDCGDHQGHDMQTQPVKDFRASMEKPFPELMDDAMTVMDSGMKNAPMTGDPDHDFAAMMIPHHQGAVDMAKVELLYGKDPVLRRLAQEIIVTQKQEIEVMRKRLK